MQRAVIYCRVSTEEEAQLNALENQIAEACKVVQQKGWILVARYIDAANIIGLRQNPTKRVSL